jgi:type III restriction enzyme
MRILLIEDDSETARSIELCSRPNASTSIQPTSAKRAIQPVENPILCNPWDEPKAHWVYNPQTGVPTKQESRRPAGYWFKTGRIGTAQLSLLVEEERDDLPLVNALQDDVRRWREAGYRGASHITRELLQYWARSDRHRRLFFCQREAVETVVYLAELRFPGRSSRTGFQRFAVSAERWAARRISFRH